MRKKTTLIRILSLAVLAVLAGCETKEPLQTTFSSPQPNTSPPPVQNVADQPLNVSPDRPNPGTNAQIEQYVKGLAAKGLSQQSQGIWMQSGNTLLANYQGTIPLPAASITKVATSLAALQTFGPDHQFITFIGITGPIQNGVVQGDLVVEGNQDPFFVWEEAIALGNLLNEKGIKRVAGDLVVTGKFYMNFESDSQKSASFLQQAFNSKIWSTEIETQYQTMPPKTPRPQIVIDGLVKFVPQSPGNVQPFAKHYSFPLAELLKKMNQYSNNLMADMLADAMGGAKVVAQKAAEAAEVPPTEIKLVNGSGLSEENRISPRAACAMLLAIERALKPYNMTVADVFAVIGKDQGILSERKLPPLAVIKSGTLDNVSALAGALPTQKQGTVWFAIMNGGEDVEGFRLQQEALLKIFLKQWGSIPASPQELTPNPVRKTKNSYSEFVKS